MRICRQHRGGNMFTHAWVGGRQDRSQWKGRGFACVPSICTSHLSLSRHSREAFTPPSPPQMELPGFPRSFPRVPRSDKHFPYRSQFAKDNMSKGSIGISSHIVNLQHDEQDCPILKFDANFRFQNTGAKVVVTFIPPSATQCNTPRSVVMFESRNLSEQLYVQ